MNPTFGNSTVLDAHAGAEDRCPNCGDARTGEYCQNCGQRRTRPEHLTVAYFVKNIFGELTDFDSKIFRTLTALLFRPGQLTAEYLADRKERYVSPVKLYLVISAVFFLLAWNAMLEIGNFREDFLANPAFQDFPKPQKVEQDFFIERWLEKSGDYMALTRFASVIGLALGLALLYVGLGRYYVEHLIFAFHYYAFDFAFFSILVLLFKTFTFITGIRVPFWILNVGYLVLLVYSYVALRRVHRESAPLTALKALGVLFLDTVLSALGGMFAMGVAYAVAYVSLSR